MPTIDPDLFRKILAITARMESGNRDFGPDGKPIRSPAGAMYKMQVLPSTAAAPGFGVAPAAAQTPEEYNRVGTDLLRTYLQKYNNPGKAWAAYHSGAGTLNKLTGQYGDQWQKGLGPQGREYVTNGVSALGLPVAPTPAPPTGIPAPERPMEEDDAEGALAASGFGAKDVMDMYKQNSMSASIVAAAKAKAREEQFKAAQEALAKQRFGPTLSERLFALSAAIGKPRYKHERGFGAMMGDLAPALSGLIGGNRDAEQKRAEALRQLRDTYTNESLNDQQEAVDARVKMFPTMASMAKRAAPSPGTWDTTRGMYVPKDRPVPVDSGVVGGQRVVKYSDGTQHLQNADGTVTVYDAAGQKIRVEGGPR